MLCAEKSGNFERSREGLAVGSLSRVTTTAAIHRQQLDKPRFR